MATGPGNVVLILVPPQYGYSNPINISVMYESDPVLEVLRRHNGNSWEKIYDEQGEQWMEDLDKTHNIKDALDGSKVIDKYLVTEILSFKC